jgi:hypothetical protein
MNGERQCYTDSKENIFTKDGILNIQAIGQPAKSAVGTDTSLYDTGV